MATTFTTDAWFGLAISVRIQSGSVVTPGGADKTVLLSFPNRQEGLTKARKQTVKSQKPPWSE